MCRLLMATGITDSSVVSNFMKAAKPTMSIGNNMGIGYTAAKSDGQFFTERWHRNDKFMEHDGLITPDKLLELQPAIETLSPYFNFPKIGVDYSKYGVDDFGNVTSLTMHTRYATCGREFENTHPFVDNDHSLVHNGVISNAFSLGLNKISTCDSEAALQAYIKKGVGVNPEAAQDWLNMLSGYWAFGIFSRDANGNRILDVVRDGAQLYATTVEGMGLVMATTPDIIADACRISGLQMHQKPAIVKENMFYRFDAVTGDKLLEVKIKPKFTNYGGWGGTSSEWEKITGQKKDTVEPSLHSSQIKEPTNYDELWDMLDDKDMSVVDKLRMYDEAFDGTYLEMYYEIPVGARQDSWASLDFMDAVDEIEQVHGFMFGKNKRA